MAFPSSVFMQYSKMHVDENIVSLSSFLRSIEFSEPKDEIISKTKFKWNVYVEQFALN